MQGITAGQGGLEDGGGSDQALIMGNIGMNINLSLFSRIYILQ